MPERGVLARATVVMECPEALRLVNALWAPTLALVQHALLGLAIGIACGASTGWLLGASAPDAHGGSPSPGVPA